MFSSFKNKPDAQKIIGNNSAACGKYYLMDNGFHENFAPEKKLGR
jgi:hypothetical protein